MNKTSAAIVRTLLLGTSCLSVVGVAQADPTGGNVVYGTATITSHGGNNTVIDQHSGKVVINWDSFSIAAGGTVRFNQPGAGSIALNRVTGSQPSTIYGDMFANGQVWLINGNGVLFGKGSQINVGGLIATTADLSNADFASGNYAFNGGTPAAVVNQGTIRAGRRGAVVLSGSSVQNQGLITADTGTVVLGGASAFTVDFQGDGLLRYAITAPAQTAANGHTGVANSGTIRAAGGRVVMTARAASSVQDAVVNNTGMVSATSATVKNGEVILDGGDGDVNAGGTIDASGTAPGQTGGSVTITGRNVTVADNARIDVSGDSGGGTVKIGGDLHGAGTLPTAANTTVGTATIKADALHKGNGGTVVVWSNGRTSFSGVVSAKGAGTGGNGGLVETSGHTLAVAPTATVDTRAPRGTVGTWLLDPDSIVIADGGNTALTGGTLPVGQDPESTDTIAPSTIVNALATTDVSLQASNDITVSNAVLYSSANTLSLLAGRDINVNASIQNAQANGGGAIYLIAGWDGETVAPGSLTAPGVFGNNEGRVTIASPNGAVAVGSASGLTTVAADAVTIRSQSGYAQLGFHGAGGGDIQVLTEDDVTIERSGTGDAQIGNGSFLSDISGDVTGDISVNVGGLFTLQVGEGASEDGGHVWLGNAASGAHSATGNVVLIAEATSGNIDVAPNVAADLAGGDFTFGVTSYDSGSLGGFEYNSPHDLTLLNKGGLEFADSLINDGTGNITLVAGWDGHTLGSALLTTPGAYGSDSEIGISIGTTDADGNVYVGSKGGTTTVLTGALSVDAEYGNAQLGYHGNGTGDVKVYATGDVSLIGEDPNDDEPYYAMIGNGAPDGSVSGAVGGNVTLNAGGTLSLSTYSSEYCGDCIDSGGGGATVNIGNANQIGSGDVTGSTTIIANGFDDGDDANGGIGRIIGADLAYGDFTIGQTDSGNDINVANDLVYDSSHNLAILSAGDLYVTANVQNAGTGAITLIAGWDGTTPATQVGAAGTYGNNDGAITIGGGEGGANASVGSAGGTTTLYAGGLTLQPSDGYAQLGYHGPGGGDIHVTTTGDITVEGGDKPGEWALIGNGGLDGDITGNITGDIFLDAGGQTVFFNGSGDSDSDTDGPPPVGGLAWLGNVAAPNFTESGNVTALTVGGFFRADFIDADLGTVAGTGGDLFLGFKDPSVSPLFIGGADYNSVHTFTFAGAGSINVTGSVQNAGTGDITLVAGWDGHTVGTAAQIQAANAYGLGNAYIDFGNAYQYQNVSYGSAGGRTTVLTHDLNISPAEGYYAQLGYHGAGGGDIVVVAGGNLSITSGSGEGQYAMIGNGSLNGDVTGNITGNIDLRVAGTTALTSGEGALPWIGNVASGTATETGNLTFVTSGFTSAADLVGMLGADLSGGDVTLGLTNASTPLFMGDGIIYSSAHTLNLLAAGSIVIASSVENGGTGAINIVAGWDGHTLDAAHFFDATVFGNNNGAVTIGGADATGDVAVGSAGGQVNLGAASLTVSGINGYGQLGYHGAGTGKISVNVPGAITLLGGEGAGDYGQIGNGASFGANTSAADVSLVSGSIGVSGNSAVVANNLKLAAASGDIGAADAQLRIAANTLDLQTAGGSVYLTSPGLGLAFTGPGIDLNGGSLTLSAGGAITQTAALHVNRLSVSTSSGAITLNSTANMVAGTVALSTPGAATFYNTVATFLGTASVGGDLTVLSKGNVTFTASIQSQTGAVIVVAGWDGSTTDPSAFGNSGVYGNGNGSVVVGSVAPGNALANEGPSGSGTAVGSKAGATQIYAYNVTVNGGGGYGQLGYHGAGGGNIQVRAMHGLTLNGTAGTGYAMIGNGSLNGDVSGAVTGDIDIRIGGVATFNGTGPTPVAWIGNKTASGGETGNFLFLASDIEGTQDCDIGCFAEAAIVGGDVTLGITSTSDKNIDGVTDYTSSHTLTLLLGGNLTISGSLQNAGNGAITVVTGWDGHTLTPSSFGTAGVSGVGGKGLTIGGAGADGNAALGSAGGTTTIYGASLSLLAQNGYAQLGYNGHGSGAISVNVGGNVALTGGATAGDFAQIGNGGLKTSGTNNGDIAITAGGDIILTAGAGTEAYAQIGHGGAESNTGANGYGNVAAITLTATNVALNAGTGQGAYAQIGNGGYEVGLNLAGGAALNGGDITITASHAVSLTGNGADGYAQIGNGGSQSNLNAAASAGGTDSGDIVVNTPNGAGGSVTLTAGAGANAYAQIGNGGYAINSGSTAVAANFTVTGDVTVTDLALTGGNTGPNAYAQIGNGDASNTGFGNISGDIFIDADGQVTYHSGSALHSQATIGNFTGQGTVSGELTGAQPPSDVTTNPVVIGVIVSNTAGNNGSKNPPITINNAPLPPPPDDSGATTLTAKLEAAAAKPGPLASLDDNNADSATPYAADSATVVIADSLDGSKKVPGVQTILPGMLKQNAALNTANTVHAVPPADQDFSSWGNEALWQ